MEKIPVFFIPVLINLIRYFLIAGLAFLVVYVVLPGLFAPGKIQKREAGKKHFLREIFQSLQSSLVIGVVIALFMATPLRDFSLLYDSADHLPVWWIPISVILALIIQDTYFYWLHRLIHQPKLYKIIHREHHLSTNPSPWTSYRFHFTEAILEALILPFILFILPMHPSALLAFGLVGFVVNVYGHLGYEIAPKWLRKTFLFELLATSVYHNLHHEKFLGNYGLYFRVWDRIMGTENQAYVKKYDEIQARRFGEPVEEAVTKPGS